MLLLLLTWRFWIYLLRLLRFYLFSLELPVFIVATIAICVDSTRKQRWRLKERQREREKFSCLELFSFSFFLFPLFHLYLSSFAPASFKNFSHTRDVECYSVCSFVRSFNLHVRNTNTEINQCESPTRERERESLLCEAIGCNGRTLFACIIERAMKTRQQRCVVVYGNYQPPPLVWHCY